jgi:uncharacterized protein
LSLLFVDTSAVAKRYITETGSTWVRSWTQPAAGNIVIILELASVEFFSLLARRAREGTLAASNGISLRNVFMLHVEKEYLTVPLEYLVVAQARSLVTKYPLRTLDAIQLASALQARQLLAEPMMVISADRNLLSASAAEGFSIDGPNAHP